MDKVRAKVEALLLTKMSPVDDRYEASVSQVTDLWRRRDWTEKMQRQLLYSHYFYVTGIGLSTLDYELEATVHVSAVDYALTDIVCAQVCLAISRGRFG